MIWHIEIFIGVFLISVLSTGIIRRYLVFKNMLDHPTERSLHDMPIPRGGGVAFVLLFNMLSIGLAVAHQISLPLFVALMGGMVIAIIGWLDDILSIHPLWRAMVHLLAAMWAIYWLPLYLSWMGYLFAIVSIAWCVNLYNFMDGIDGLAGMEGLFISLGVAFILSRLGDTEISLLCFLLAAALSGFLVWNWPPAKIFMGDVGSGYLGYIFAVFAIATIHTKILPFIFWIAISAVFLCDTTFTVLYRMYHGERWYEAHRKHAYQCLIQYGADHKTVTLSTALINALILFPLAYTMLSYPNWRYAILSFILCVLFLLWNAIMNLS